MNSEFKNLMENFANEWENAINSETLEQLQDRYTNSESSREEILTWIFENINSDEEQGEYFNFFGEMEASLIDDSDGLPIFDQEFDIYESFDEYEAYYQRYGCLTPEFVISWDTTNILFDDGDGNIEIVSRPDVLMGDIG